MLVTRPMEHCCLSAAHRRQVRGTHASERRLRHTPLILAASALLAPTAAGAAQASCEQPVVAAPPAWQRSPSRACSILSRQATSQEHLEAVGLAVDGLEERGEVHAAAELCEMRWWWMETMPDGSHPRGVHCQLPACRLDGACVLLASTPARCQLATPLTARSCGRAAALGTACVQASKRTVREGRCAQVPLGTRRELAHGECGVRVRCSSRGPSATPLF